MAKLVRRKFWRRVYSEGDDWETRGRGCVLCGEEFADAFHVPKKVEKVWVTLHTDPGPQRLRVELQSYDDDGRRVAAEVVETQSAARWSVATFPRKWIEQDRFPRFAYAEVEYAVD